MTTTGDIDYSTSPGPERVLSCVGEAGFPSVTIDLTQVRFIDSTALTAFAVCSLCRLTDGVGHAAGGVRSTNPGSATAPRRRGYVVAAGIGGDFHKPWNSPLLY
jgi:hypothetical protein